MSFPKPMLSPLLRKMLAAALLVATHLTATSLPAGAQSTPDQKPAEQKPSAGDRREAVPKRIDEIAEVGRLLTGPAANPECVWLGRRVISLLWRDDLDTAFRHLDLYDRFGCPGGHIQATFRCMVRLPEIEKATDALKAADALNARIHACWINPSVQPAPPAATAATPPPENGTTSR
jgi:hypothetical protein